VCVSVCRSWRAGRRAVFIAILAVSVPQVYAQAQTADRPPEYFAVEPPLREFVRRALEAQPGLKEAEARYRAALERVPQVTALPDPTLTFTQMLRSVETRVGPKRRRRPSKPGRRASAT
jgi:outer membrane protein TolC